jgi:hypothetical protein
VRSESGAPVAGATVRSCRDEEWSTVTDQKGDYALRTDSLNQMRSTSVLMAEHPDHLRKRAHPNLPADLLANRTIRCDIEMSVGLPIRILVVDERDLAVEGVRVALTEKSDGIAVPRHVSLEAWSRRDWFQEFKGTGLRYFDGISDATGRLVITAPATTLRLKAWKPGLIWHSEGIRDLDVVNGMEEIVVVVDRGASFLGSVVDPSGLPVPQAKVVVWRRGYRNPVKVENNISSTSTDELGGFRFTGLRRDVQYCDILLVHPAFASTHYTKVELVDGMTLTIKGGRTVELRLVDAVTGFAAECEPKLSLLRHNLTYSEPQRSLGVSVGLQEWRQVSDGELIRVSHVPEFASAITITCEAYDPETVILEPGQAGATEPIVVLLTPTWDMECKVVDSTTGRCIPGAKIELFGSWMVDGKHKGNWQAEVIESRLVEDEERLYVNSQWLKPEWWVYCRVSHPDYAPAPVIDIKPYGAPAPRHFRITLDPKE